MIYDQDTGVLLVSFNTYINNNYHNSNTVAFEPLERGSFSSDSKQNTPFSVSITGIINIKQDTTLKSVDTIRKELEDLCKSPKLLLLKLQPMIRNISTEGSQYAQYGLVYSNMSLVSLDYDNNPDQLEFRPTMTFQEIRLTDSEFALTQNTANPENGSLQNKGQVQPKEDTSFAFKVFGKVPL